MKIKFTIEYYTSHNEIVFINIDNSLSPLSTDNGYEWSTIIDIEPQTISYSYVIYCHSEASRYEWGSSRRITLRKGINELHIYDRWQDSQQMRPFYSSLFTNIILQKPNNHTIQPQENKVVIVVDTPQITNDEELVIISEMGNWSADKCIKLSRISRNQWSTPSIKNIRGGFKFAIIKGGTNDVIWELGNNRHIEQASSLDDHSAATILNVKPPQFDTPAWRGIGVAIPLFSLRGVDGMGVGEFQDLKDLADWAAATGMKIIQLLPINDTTMYKTWEDSYPYNANSSFALHPQYISLLKVGILSNKEALDDYIAEGKRLNLLEEVDYVAVNKLKDNYLRAIYHEIGDSTLACKDFKLFFKNNKTWLEPYALYSHLRDKYNSPDFTLWGDESTYNQTLLKQYTTKGTANYANIAYYYFVQYHLHIQLVEAKEYAASKHVAFKGDIPIGVSRNSADVWVSPQLFRLDTQAGAPPDDFSVMGQNWGFPTYNWEEMSRDNYAWWVARFRKMAEYFDAYRIDHILGFFRIWEIPTTAMHGLQGVFNPALPYSIEEITSFGFEYKESYTKPYITDWVIEAIFKDNANSVTNTYLSKEPDGSYSLKEEYNTQAKISNNNSIDKATKEGLMSLLNEVLFIEDRQKPGYYHPRISAYNSYVYRTLSDHDRDIYMSLYNNFYYQRHNEFWRDNALNKLPDLISATRMLTCGEDLGMIPDSVPQVMANEQILSLEIQRMPKEPWRVFGDPSSYPYYSVCTTSTHDMNPLRAWWLEDRELTQQYYNCVLGYDGVAPSECDDYICERIILDHLSSPAMLTILPLQDWLSIDASLRKSNATAERINIPSSSRHYWRYRMHITINKLINSHNINDKIISMIAQSQH